MALLAQIGGRGVATMPAAENGYLHARLLPLAALSIAGHVRSRPLSIMAARRGASLVQRRRDSPAGRATTEKYTCPWRWGRYKRRIGSGRGNRRAAAATWEAIDMNIRLAATVVAAAALAAAPAFAKELVLKGVSAFPEGTLYSTKFETFVKQVNKKGKGILRINYLGGAPKVMPTFDVGKNLRDGLIDIMSGTGAYYTNVVPEADALKLTELPMSELRKNGGWALINKIHNEKMKAYYLARIFNYDVFHIYLNKKIDKPDFTGLKIRVTPIYRAMVEKLGGTAVTSAAPDVYTMLERNTVDGYGWPARGIFDFSWQKVTKYRVDPGFYNADIEILVNLNVWNRLDTAQKKLLTDLAMAMENDDSDKALNDAERKKQAEAGIQSIRFSPADEKKYVETIREAGWDAVMKASPKYGPEMRKLFTKQ
jgi:TRAP-type C4-dicarboxylate transport system substrate-binding protein